jgi:hypothetical protein
VRSVKRAEASGENCRSAAMDVVGLFDGIEIEIVYNMNHVSRLLSLGPPTMPLREPTSQGYTVYRLSPTSPKCAGGFSSPPGSVLCMVVAACS